MKPIISLNNVHAGYGKARILSDVSLQVGAGEFVALMGPNGAGKSSVLKSIFGLCNLYSGSVTLRGEKILPVAHRMAHIGVAYVPQGRRVFKHLTVEENLEIGAWIVKDKVEVKRRIQEVYDLFPTLRKKRKESSLHLSGGQQQMLAIARGLMTEPDLLLLDEPTLGLSPKLVKMVFQKIQEINEQRRMAILVVEHNIASLLHVVSRAYVLDHGKVAVCDTAQNLAKSDTLEKIFLGTYAD